MTSTAPLYALVLALLIGLLGSGCQSLVPMTRQDADASLSRPDDWLREREANRPAGTLFQIRHPEQPVRMRLRRLPSPLIAEAHRPWLRLWLQHAFDEHQWLADDAASLGAHEALRVEVSATDNSEPLAVELSVANAGGQTYLLEAWGAPEAMAETEEMRRRVRRSARLPQEAGDVAAPKAETIEGPGFRLTLPGEETSPDDVAWRVRESGDGAALAFELPSRLIEGRLIYEELDYPIDAVTYAQTALRRAHGEAEAPDASPSAHDVRHVLTGSTDAAVPMQLSYRFVTEGEDAVQLVVSTPASVYEKNQEVIDALVDSMELKVAPSKPAPSREAVE